MQHSARVTGAKRHHKIGRCSRRRMWARMPISTHAGHMRSTTRLICRHQPSVGCCQIPIETVRSYSVAYALVPCRAGAPAAKQRNGSRSREYICILYTVTQKRDEHASERAWNGNVPLKLTRLTKRDENLEHHVGGVTGDGQARQGLGRRQNNLDLPVCTEE